VSPAVVNGLVLSVAALLTLLLVASLIVVIRLPSWPTLDPAAEQELDSRKAQFGAELRRRALARAERRGKEVSKKDIRAEYRGLRIRKRPRAFERVTSYGGVTISGAGLAIAVPSLPHFPPISSGVEKFLSGAGIIVAAIAMVFDGSEFLRNMVGRHRKPGNVIGTSAEERNQLRHASGASRYEEISERAEKELQRCCERLVKDVEKEARLRWAGEMEITTGNIEKAWGELVRPYDPQQPAEGTIAAPSSRRKSILLGLATLVAIIVVAGILYFVFSLVKPKLPAGRYWPAVVIMATLIILYLVLINIRRIIGALASWLAEGLSWLARTGSGLVGGLFRVRRGKDQAILPSHLRIGPNAVKEGPATAESTPDGDKGAGTGKLAGRGAIMASTSGTSATKDGPGTISDALAALEAQAARLPAGPAPDPNVSVAYALGWAVGDAFTCTKYQAFDHLVKVPELDHPADQWILLVNQIISHCSRLNNHLESTQADLDLSAQLTIAASLTLGPPPGDVKTAVGVKNATVIELQTGILAVLWSVASPLAKAYQLGNGIEQMCATPIADPSTTVSTSVETHNTTIHRLLTALASKLPANSAHATDNSLRLWSASVSAGGEESPEDLLLQGRRWHEVLAGDVSGKDGLRLTDYVAAADSVAGKLGQTARQVVARFKVWLIVALIILAGGIALIVVGTKGAIGAGITAVLAAFGLTWKGIGDFFGRAAAKGEEQLWDAEIDWAIAYRFTILRHPPPDNKLRPRSKELKIDQPTKEHLRRYKQWKKNWPDVLTS
jgi:hypothetical protein